MPRNPTEPSPPDSPASWLANFRYFRAGDDGEHLSPEALGARLGVSGATVRRWEAGHSKPNEADLRRFAAVCRLTPLQQEFLFRLFARSDMSASGSPANFRAEAMRVLSIPRPAFVFDELFYIRAWNSYFPVYAGEFTPKLAEGVNAIHLGLAMQVLDDPAEEAERVRSIVYLMWMWTAHLAAHPAYKETVAQLLQLPAFADAWTGIAREPITSSQRPLALPLVQCKAGDNLFTVYTSQVLFPPLYHTCVYEPRDEKAVAHLESQVNGSSPTVAFASRLHWAD